MPTTMEVARYLFDSLPVFGKKKVQAQEDIPTKFVPESVNYHFTRKCNYSCGFCFHTQKNSFVLDLEKAKRGLRILAEAGMRKINFAGGEPFLYPAFLGALVKYCKEELQVESVSIVTNGSKVKEDWFQKYGSYLDILAISCDSFEEATNKKIGRGTGKHVQSLIAARDLCKHYSIKFKINTVVNRYNHEEDMNDHIMKLAPFRWKVFQVLALDGENTGDNAKTDVSRFLISKDEFQGFLDRHKAQKCLVPESNEAMQNSYLLMDEKMCFLDCSSNGKIPSESILEVGVAKALQQSGFDQQMFHKRGGIYDWVNERTEQPTGCGSSPSLEW